MQASLPFLRSGPATSRLSRTLPAFPLTPSPPNPPPTITPRSSGTYSVEAAKELPFPRAGGATGSIR